MKYVFALVFSGLTAAALAGAPPQECDACKPVKAMVVDAPSCSAEAASCAGAKASCSGRRSFAQWRADRIAARSAARQARAEARSCAGSKSCAGEAKQIVILCEQGNCD